MTVFSDPSIDGPLRAYEDQAEQRENTRPDEYDDWTSDLGNLTDSYELCVAAIDAQEITAVARAGGVLHD